MHPYSDNVVRQCRRTAWMPGPATGRRVSAGHPLAPPILCGTGSGETMRTYRALRSAHGAGSSSLRAVESPTMSVAPLQFLLLVFAAWVNRRQLEVIEDRASFAALRAPYSRMSHDHVRDGAASSAVMSLPSRAPGASPIMAREAARLAMRAQTARRRQASDTAPSVPDARCARLPGMNK